MAQLARLLQTDMASLAKMLEKQGRGKDTVLAHITPKEAALLKARGGRGSRNPATGLLEFEDVPLVETPTTQVSTPTTVTSEPVVNVQAGGSDAGGGGLVTPSPAPEISVFPGAQPTEGPTQQAAAQQLGYGLTDYQGLNVPISPTQLGTGTAGIVPQQPVLTDQQLSTQLGFPAAPTTGPTPEAAAALPEQPSAIQKLLSGLSTDQLARLGLTGALGLAGVSRAKQGAKQVQAATAQEQAIAQPYQVQGQALTGAALRGELSPASMQAYQAAQAQLNQQIANRGGVGAAQAASQLETLRNQLLSNQYSMGLQVSQIGDNIALGAIQTGLQLDQQLNVANQNFYTSLAAIAAGVPFGTRAA